MSLPRFSIDDVTPYGYKYGLAIRILEEVAPKLISINNPLTTRIATAYSWFVFLEKAKPDLCRDKCGLDFNRNYKEWGEEELEKIAEALAEYATMMLKEILRIDVRGGGLFIPKPP